MPHKTDTAARGRLLRPGACCPARRRHPAAPLCQAVRRLRLFKTGVYRTTEPVPDDVHETVVTATEGCAVDLPGTITSCLWLHVFLRVLRKGGKILSQRKRQASPGPGSPRGRAGAARPALPRALLLTASQPEGAAGCVTARAVRSQSSLWSSSVCVWGQPSRCGS